MTNSTVILNKCAAIISADFGTQSELGRYLGKPRQRIHEWLSRDVVPHAETLNGMSKWASAKTLGIAAAGNKVQTAYRTAYLEVCKKFPVNGKE